MVLPFTEMAELWASMCVYGWVGGWVVGMVG